MIVLKSKPKIKRYYSRVCGFDKPHGWVCDGIWGMNQVHAYRRWLYKTLGLKEPRSPKQDSQLIANFLRRTS